MGRRDHDRDLAALRLGRGGTDGIQVVSCEQLVPLNDLARVANVEALVTRSISGHLTEQMREHYSTVSPMEQRESIGRVLRLVQRGGEPQPEDREWCASRCASPGTGVHSRLGVR